MREEEVCKNVIMGHIGEESVENQIIPILDPLTATEKQLTRNCNTET